jgi:hypothetical protein
MSTMIRLDPQVERNRALAAAEHDRAAATRDADMEYSETVAKLRWSFESELVEAAARRRARVLPAHRAYNAAVVAAEQTFAAATLAT